MSLAPLLLHAAGYNHLDVVEHLLEHKADVNAKDKGGLIPLHNAASFGVRIKEYSYLIVYYILYVCMYACNNDYRYDC